MKCYHHELKDAVGICKSCGKALCKDCVSLSSNSINCKHCCLEVTEQKIPEQYKSFTHMLVIFGTFLLICGSGTIFLSIAQSDLSQWIIGGVLTMISVSIFKSVKGYSIHEIKEEPATAEAK